jgi:prepilin peptidase CpaA
MLAGVLLLGLVLVASATDLLQHKIYNWTTYTGILAALGLSAVGNPRLSTRTIDQCLMGLAVCGLPMLACYVFFRIRGGDVKLIAMLGTFLGPDDGVKAMLWTFVFGACVGVVVLIWRVGPARLIAAALRRMVWMLRLAGWAPLTSEERALLAMPLHLAPSALAAVLMVQFGPF